jgi:hypothetical protein
MNTPSKLSYYWPILLVFILTACSRGPKFSAPEIEPPSDLIPSYVPENFELVSGFKINPGDFKARISSGNDDDLRVPWDNKTLFHPFRSTFSPAGNETLGVYYHSKDQIILITKSYFPGGTLEFWRADYEKTNTKECECECPHLELVIGIPIPLRFAEIQEERTINGTPVAILKGYVGWMTVFVRGDYLLSVESGISLEENLKIVTSLLKQ